MSIVTNGPGATRRRQARQGVALGLAMLAGVGVAAASGCEAGEGFVPGLSGWSSAGAAERPWRVEVPASDTSSVHARRILPGDIATPWGAVSPDGRFYADQGPGDQVTIRAVETGAVRTIPAEAHPEGVLPRTGYLPTFAPDGRTLAFQTPTETGADLWLVDLEAERASLVAHVEQGVWLHPHAWAPDGTALLVVRQSEDRVNQILSVSMEDGSVQVLRTLGWNVRPGHLAVSPDGRHLAYDAPDEANPEGPRHVFALALDGTRETRLVGDPAEDVLLGWTSDGRHLIFGSDRAGTMGAWLLPVEDGRAAGEPVLVKPDLWNVQPLGVASDGRLFYAVEMSSPEVHTATVDLEGGQVVEPPAREESAVPGITGFPAWSPDGRRLALAAQRPDGSLAGVTIRDLPTGEVHRVPLPDTIRYPGGLAWSAGGDLLLLQERRRILRVDPRTGVTTEVYRVASARIEDGIYQFSPDPTGDRVLANVLRQDLRLIDLADGSSRVVLPDYAYRANPVLAPDGRRVAFFELRGPDWVLAVVDLATGRTAELLTFSRGGGAWPGLAWSADGRFLLYAHHFGDAEAPYRREMRRVAVEGGEPEPLGLEGEAISSLALHPDGRRLAYEAGARIWELWVLEGLPGGPAADVVTSPEARE